MEPASSPREHVTRPSETAVFEGSLCALKTAKAAGYTVFGVFDAHGESDQDGMRSAADVYVTRLADTAIISDTHWGCAR